MNLIFEATDKNIGNYSYSGGKLKEIGKLNEAANVSAYIDDTNLIVRNRNTALQGYEFSISQENGMIGTPSINERGVTVKTLFNNDIIIGSLLNVTSLLNPNATGTWLVNKITYDLQNRESIFLYEY